MFDFVSTICWLLFALRCLKHGAAQTRTQFARNILAVLFKTLAKLAKPVIFGHSLNIITFLVHGQIASRANHDLIVSVFVIRIATNGTYDFIFLQLVLLGLWLINAMGSNVKHY
jgi:hypothetical protein